MKWCQRDDSAELTTFGVLWENAVCSKQTLPGNLFYFHRDSIISGAKSLGSILRWGITSFVVYRILWLDTTSNGNHVRSIKSFLVGSHCQGITSGGSHLPVVMASSNTESHSLLGIIFIGRASRSPVELRRMSISLGGAFRPLVAHHTIW